MKTLKKLLKHCGYTIANDEGIRDNVVSKLKNENQRIERRLSVCMKQIQQSMAKQRQQKNSYLESKVSVKTSNRPIPLHTY